MCSSLGFYFLSRQQTTGTVLHPPTEAMRWPFSIPQPYDAQVRTRAQEAPSQSSGPRSYLSTPKSQEPDWSNSWLSGRSLKQFSVFAAGATCVVLSTLVTRRALARKYLSIKPAGLFSPSNKVPEAQGSLDAAQALTLATMNVGSFGLMMVGGGLWAFDISSMNELRAKVRRGMGTDGNEEVDAELEEDIEEWMAVMLARLQGKNDKDIGEMLKEVGNLGQRPKPRADQDQMTKDS